MVDENDYRLEMEKKLNDLSRKINELKAKVTVLGEEKNREFYKHLDEFNAQHEELKSKLQDLNKLESEAQAALKRYLEDTYQSLSENLEIRLAPYVEEK